MAVKVNLLSEKLKTFAKSHSWIFRSGLLWSNPQTLTLAKSDAFLSDPKGYLENNTKTSFKRLKRQPIQIELIEPDVISIETSLPKNLRKHSAKALKIDVQKKIPIPIDALTSRHDGGVLENEKIKYTQTIAKRSKLLLLEKTFEAIGIQVARFTHEGIQLTNLKNSVAPKADKIWIFSTIFAPLALLSGFTLFETGKLQEDRAALETEQLINDKLRAEIIQLSNKKAEENSQAEAISEVLNEINQGRKGLTLITELSAALDDQVWISQWDLKDNKVSISGFSKGDVPTLIETISNLEIVSKAVQKSSSKRDQRTKKIRFQMDAFIESEGAN